MPGKKLTGFWLCALELRTRHEAVMNFHMTINQLKMVASNIWEHGLTADQRESYKNMARSGRNNALMTSAEYLTLFKRVGLSTERGGIPVPPLKYRLYTQEMLANMSVLSINNRQSPQQKTPSKTGYIPKLVYGRPG